MELYSLVPVTNSDGADVTWRTPIGTWNNTFQATFGRSNSHFPNASGFDAGVAEARVLCEGYRREYNEERPHQSLGYLTPNEFKQKWLQSQSHDPGD